MGLDVTAFVLSGAFEVVTDIFWRRTVMAVCFLACPFGPT
jgi:hypothetical protein